MGIYTYMNTCTHVDQKLFEGMIYCKMLKYILYFIKPLLCEVLTNDNLTEIDKQQNKMKTCFIV